MPVISNEAAASVAVQHIAFYGKHGMRVLLMTEPGVSELVAFEYNGSFLRDVRTRYMGYSIPGEPLCRNSRLAVSAC